MVCYWQGDSVADATGFVRYHMDGRVQRGVRRGSRCARLELRNVVYQKVFLGHN